MTLGHPGHDLAIVIIRNTLGTDSSLFLLALSAFSRGVFAMAATTSLAHLKGIIWREILGTSFDRTSTKRRVGGGESGRRLKVDVIWVVAHPDAGLGKDVLSLRSAAACHNSADEIPPFGVIITHSPLKSLPYLAMPLALTPRPWIH
jgi:hypothetical protein